jgi:uncharacterized protein Yka (UPF0111/DUF47 family)
MKNKELKFLEYLRLYTSYCGKAGTTLDLVMTGGLSAKEGFNAMREIKRDSRRTQSLLTEKMYRAFKEPAQVHEVRLIIGKMDDIINGTKDVLNQLTVYKEEEAPKGIHTMAHLIRYALEELVKTVDYTVDVEDNLMKMEARSQRIYNMEERGDEVCQETLRDLFYGNHDALYVIRWRSILLDMEQILDLSAGILSPLQRVM